MKYIACSCLMILICIALAVLTVRLLRRKRSLSGPAGAAAAVVLSVIYILAAGLIYMSCHEHADARALSSLNGSADVEVSETENGYLFDGPGRGSAVIFYPGAKVEAEAYAPLMLALAEAGEDAFLVDMPFDFALFGIGSAEELIEDHDYGSWYLMGHSLGGTAANIFASDEEEDIDGLIYLASYPSKDLDDSIGMLSVYGSADGCLDRGEYEKSRPLWPEDAEEIVIEGGNHSQFGDYGLQRGDGEATITAEEQQDKTVEAIIRFIEEKQ